MSQFTNLYLGELHLAAIGSGGSAYGARDAGRPGRPL